jgi:hypothetical protein
MAQVEHPANLDRWGNPAYRLATLILIHCGLRISDALGSNPAASPLTPTQRVSALLQPQDETRGPCPHRREH